MDTLKILAMPTDDGGCGNYRIRQPFEMIKRFTKHDAHVVSPDEDSVNLASAINVADLLVIRPGAEEGLQKILSIKEFRNKPYVIDIDDNTELISPYSKHYDEYGTENFFDNHRNQWLWKDGETIDLKKNRARLQMLLYGMRNANMITVTTEKLAEYARQYNPRVKVLPNYINLERWWKPAFVHSRKLRIGWSGGISHYEDLESIKEPLNRLMSKYQFTFVMAGQGFPGLIEKQNQHLLETHDWVPFKGHSYRMMCLNLDIGVIPLVDLPFNHYKSAIKFLEFSAMGVPSVVANVGPYAEVATPQTASLYNTPNQFYRALELLILDKKVRQNLAMGASRMVKTGFDARKHANEWVEAYTAVLKG